jgi:hypothetical protein
MSYDLMVFDPDLAPQKGQIGDWHRNMMDADERDFQVAFDPASGQSNRLKAFYDDMRPNFPAMNGPDGISDDDVDNDKVTGYAFYPGFIYMDFRWSASEAAAEAVPALARKHGLGLYDPQGETVVLPQGGPNVSRPW